MCLGGDGGSGLGVDWPDSTYRLWDLGGLPKASKPRTPHLRNWGTVRMVRIQYTSINHSAQYLALRLLSAKSIRLVF